MKNILILSSALFSLQTFSAPFCQKLFECVPRVSKLTGKKYIYDSKGLKGAIDITENYKIDKNNADEFISLALNKNGYTRVPIEGGYEIVQTRDIRYTPTPMIDADKQEIPATHDYIMATFALKGIKSTELTRSFRPFMTRYGRLIDIKHSNQIIVQDTGYNVKRLLKIARSMDFEPTEDQLKEMKKREKERRDLERVKAKNCSYLSEDIKELSRKFDSFKKE